MKLDGKRLSEAINRESRERVTAATVPDESRCRTTNPLLMNGTHSRCQRLAGHGGECAFPIDDAFLDALDDGLIIVGRPPRRKKKRWWEFWK